MGGFGARSVSLSPRSHVIRSDVCVAVLQFCRQTGGQVAQERVVGKGWEWHGEGGEVVELESREGNASDSKKSYT